ncbi:MAG: hypothetical protein ACXV3F_03460 [Frankiaceae bacterium]
MSAAQPWATPGPPPATGRARTGWTAGRVVAIVIGSVLALAGLAILAFGLFALVIDQTQRDNDGYLTSGRQQFATAGVALTSDNIELYDVGTDFLGKVLIRGTSANRQLFLGIGPTNQVNAYLANVPYSTVTDFSNGNTQVTNHAPATSRPLLPGQPRQQNFWVAQVTGSGTQTLTWEVQDGSWTAVAMNANGSPQLTVNSQLGVEVPALTGIGIGFLVAGLVVLIGAAFLIIIPIRRAGRKPAVAAGTAGGVWTPPGAPAPGQMPPPGGAGAYPPAPSTGAYPPAPGSYPPPPETGYPPPTGEAVSPAQPTPPPAPPDSPEPPAPPPGKTL